MAEITNLLMRSLNEIRIASSKCGLMCRQKVRMNNKLFAEQPINNLDGS